mgnify:CR=1 FL=1
MNIWIEVPEFLYNFQVDGKTIEIKSVDIDANFVWKTHCEDNNLPLTETPKYDCAKIGMKPIKVQF